MELIGQSDLEALFAKVFRESFDGRPPAVMPYPDVQGIDWGVLDYFGWVHRSGHLGFVVMPDTDGPKAMVLRRLKNDNYAPRPQMCAWCHFVHRRGGIALFSGTVAGSDGRRSVGNFVCRNLDCSLRIRNLTGDTPGYLPETLSVEAKRQRLLDRLHDYHQRLYPGITSR